MIFSKKIAETPIFIVFWGVRAFWTKLSKKGNFGHPPKKKKNLTDVVEPHLIVHLMQKGVWSTIMLQAGTCNRWRLSAPVLRRLRNLDVPPAGWMDSLKQQNRLHERVDPSTLSRPFTAEAAHGIADLLRQYAPLMMQCTPTADQGDLDLKLATAVHCLVAPCGRAS